MFAVLVTFCGQSLLTEGGARGQAILPVRSLVAVGVRLEHEVVTTLHQRVVDGAVRASAISPRLVARMNAAVSRGRVSCMHCLGRGEGEAKKHTSGPNRTFKQLI